MYSYELSFPLDCTTTRRHHYYKNIFTVYVCFAPYQGRDLGKITKVAIKKKIDNTVYRMPNNGITKSEKIKMTLLKLAAALLIAAGVVIGAMLIPYFSETERPYTNPGRNSPNRRKKYYTEYCVVCLWKKSDVEIVPCGHICLCSECAKSYFENAPVCPMCRQHVDSLQLVSRATHLI